MEKNSSIFLAGHSGMVGSALYRLLVEKGFSNIIVKNRSELNLLNQSEVNTFFSEFKPEYVILAAAKVGGIKANNEFRADFIYENSTIQNNVIHAAYENKVQKLLFLGSSCIYPKHGDQPLKEGYLLSGFLEKTNEPYALAKILGIKMCENYYRQYKCNFISFMPTNMFGENDNYDLNNSHVIPALIRKIHLAHAFDSNNWEVISKDLIKNPIQELGQSPSQEEIKSYFNAIGIKKDHYGKVIMEMWGSGKAMREFMHVDDFASSCLELFLKVDAKELYEVIGETQINIGTGKDISILELAKLIQKIIGFQGEFIWGNDSMDGTLKKCLDISVMESLTGKKEFDLEKRISQNYLTYLNE